MKLAPLTIAAALVCGSALAQAPDAAQRAENRAKAGEVVDKGADATQRAGKATMRGARKAADATGNVARKGAAKVRETGDAIARRLPPAPEQRQLGEDRGGRSAMGAGSTTAAADDRGDDARQQRMDAAYDNWRRQQGQR